MIPRLLAPLCAASLLLAGTPAAAAADATTPQLACLRLLQTSGLSNRYEKVCNDVIDRDTRSDPVITTALRRLMEERAGSLPARALGELLQVPAEVLAGHAGNPVLLLYVSRVMMAPESLRQMRPETVARVEALASAALQQPALREPHLRPYLQGLLMTTSLLHLHQRNPEAAATLLARLETTCIDAYNCFEVYSGATLPFGERPHLNSYRKLASLLAERHGIGDWRTGVVAMAISGMLPPMTADTADGRESIFRPFLAEWTKADVLSRQPAATAWYVSIAGLRYERGDCRGAREVTALLWPRLREGRLPHYDVRAVAEIGVNSHSCLGQYEEAMAMDAEFSRVWREKYLPRLAATP